MNLSSSTESVNSSDSNFSMKNDDGNQKKKKRFKCSSEFKSIRGSDVDEEEEIKCIAKRVKFSQKEIKRDPHDEQSSSKREPRSRQQEQPGDRRPR